MAAIPDATVVREHSVTARDQEWFSYNFYVVPFSGLRSLIPISPDLPPYWTYYRDIVLASSIFHEGMWSSAISVAISKLQGTPYKVNSETALRAKMGHQLFAEIDFMHGYSAFMGKVVRDFLTTDNGCFIEIVRSSSAPGAKIIGLAHLDSLRCRRTGDDQHPVIYRDNTGTDHVMRDYQIITISDMPSPLENLFGVGFCATSRAWPTIYKMAAMERYISEKISGRRPLEVYLVSGINQKQLDEVIKGASADADTRGLTSYMGAAVQATSNNQKVELVSIPFSSIPDPVNLKEERDDAYLRYADALGLDVQEIQPLHGRAMGTAAQSQILDDKATGKGLFAFMSALSEQFNLKVLPDATTHVFMPDDFRDQKMAADVKLLRAQTRQVQVATKEISTEQAMLLAADVGDIPRNFLPAKEASQDLQLDQYEKASISIPSDDMYLALTPAQEQQQQLEQEKQQQAALLQVQTQEAINQAAGVAAVQPPPAASNGKRAP